MSRPKEISPVHWAVMRQNLAEALQALSAGADVDALDREGRTALFCAAQDGEVAIVAELIRRGSNVNAQDGNLETPLHFAAREYRCEAAELLINSGANVSAQDFQGNTPLWRAVFESGGRGDMIKLLLSAGSDKTLKNKHGTSPEELAKSIGNFDVSVFLQSVK